MIYNKEINGVKFTLVCESWIDRISWGHKVTLYRGGGDMVMISSYRIRYYNRTWESYQYCSAIQCAISKAIESIEMDLKNVFKQMRGYKIITAKRAKEFAAYLQKDTNYMLYSELYGMF